MSGTLSDPSGTTAVRAELRIDETALARWMSTHITDYCGPLHIDLFKGGQSNPTYRLTTPSRQYVLRRKPPGLLLRGAHAIDREVRVMTALARAGFPVPRIYGLCQDDAVLGTCFYVMDLVEGRIFWDAALPSVCRDERPAYFDAMNETIARLHGIDPDAIGLGDFGRPGNYFERQITRWAKQYRGEPDAGRYAVMDQLIEWLLANIPPGEERAIVHGDFRIDNMIFHPTEPRIVAVLDWELSTIGHPLADFAYHAMMYRMPPEIVAGLAGADLAALNLPDEGTYIEAYRRRTGRGSIEGVAFHAAFNFFRLAAIFHGISGRAQRGTASSESASKRGGAFSRLADIGWSLATAGLDS